MPVQIAVADNAYQEKLITLNGNSLFITFTYNSREQRWYFSVSDRNKNLVVAGVKIVTGTDLTRRYLELTDLLGGSFLCIDIKDSGQEITRDNFGTDRQFQLWYLTNQELKDISNGTFV